ncbi:MAG: coproporphyrinogen III oxidase [Candidatus Zixiibacteriota bacterium]|nr:MAG: coproporphyrinogen III oxidase [candidate division Zixibacteria bacterium]
MAGIYIHIPFCKSKCYYCDFYSSVNLSYKKEFLNALFVELNLRKDFLEKQTIKTIYFGGGTPSLLSAGEIQAIIDKIQATFHVDYEPEITIEANPEDLIQIYIKNLATTSVNRVSIGIQSFNDKNLEQLNRRHNAKQAIKSISDLKSVGFSNISADLIYGLPKLSLKEWENSITDFFKLEIPHLSAYHLTYEENTVFGHRLKKGIISPVTEIESIAQYKLLCQMMSDNNYQHYEISNFCRPEKFSIHNTNYWNNTHYLGLGPAAHSYNGNIRLWNKSNLAQYLSNLSERKLPPHEKEILLKTDKFNDYILTGLRTTKGINLTRIQDDFPDFLKNTKKKIDELKDAEDLCSFDGNYFKLTEKGFFVADAIMEKFIITN